VTSPVTEIGDLNRRLALEAPSEANDGAGGVTRSYSAATTLWAQVLPLSARVGIEADRLGGFRRYRITIRMRSGITTRHRFRDGECVYRILATRESADRRFLEIEAEECEGGGAS
jgi:SPP1 family predicted phage head-tail adaptor